ncbi:MAG: hypothetical protein DRJ42_02450 [Deltaproteobacteria bacterium]|nr:MAG: hypothetical protein DRJ42_02450 [Deltaproteobacteria bacterium]
MTDAAKKLMDEAMELPVEERKRIGAALLDSVDDEAIRELVLRRVGDLEHSDVAAADAMAVYHRLRDVGECCFILRFDLDSN